MEKKFKVAAVIAEYNPFHRGHNYLMSQTRLLGQVDYIVVVMSGDFVQRGEPAVVDKYFRTRMALAGGADLVIELPAAYATATAEDFACGAVSILDTLGVVDMVSFGTESMELDGLETLARILVEEPDEYRAFLKEGLRQGLNFPLAREQALCRYLQGLEDRRESTRKAGKEASKESSREASKEGSRKASKESSREASKEGSREARMAEELHGQLTGSNNILGLEYMKALMRRDSSIKAMAVKRQGAAYHETDLSKDFPSATGIRNFLKESGTGQTSRLMAMTGLGRDLAEDLADRYGRGDRVDWDDLMALLDYQIIYSDLTGYLGLDAELAGRIRHFHRAGMSFGDLTRCLHARHRTDTALQRALLHLVLQIGDRRLPLKQPGSLFPYIRVLGFKRKAGPLLAAVRDRCPVPLIQKYSDRRLLDDEALYFYDIDMKCETLYEQIAAGKSGRRAVHVGERQQVIV